MKKHIYSLLVLMAVLFFQETHAQQDPQYTQYMYNMNVINPAYAGSKESLSLTALYRNQWSGMEGNPITFTFSADSPITDKIGLGLSAIKDELGPVSETNVYADFSYTLQLGGTTKLALGLKAGATFHEVGLANLDLQDPNDPFFSENINNTYPNIGAGAFLYGEKFYVGLSVPNMLQSVHLDENGIKYGSETNHYFATAGYVFQVSESFKLKPSAMVKSAFDAPVSFDVNLNALMYDRFELGASYRLDDSFSGLVGFQITPNIRVGYAYDHVTSDLKTVGPASHEVVLTFDVFFKPRVLRSPRFF
ncbi:type IX secretion system membrane protein PorP/SprF [Aequorivita sp. SDUM287046]|uniref:Type IX secretion system membrane protein PorP/SprF n=1 Tax=Aequorivita aurantiaca TaxID=3053356 RepID=A0ABT8DCQ0_9FLAO|nr:type IX secretion system membrane protein PorP/SprF [Aequorivita aurantiaca]MDN3722912.1 type IX secretion system membrane protein PorP/SprF [Aequorivita aurantiaca]